MAWDRIRRTVQYRINLAAATWRIEALNRVLPQLQDEFENALNQGELLSLESNAASWADDIIEELNA